MLRTAVIPSFLALTIASLGACTQPAATATPEPPVRIEPTAPQLVAETPAPESEPTPAVDTREVTTMTLPPRPDWTDKYAGSAHDERFFDIAALMQAHDLDRARAVELQNHFRDLTRADPRGDRQAQYDEALRRAKAGEFEDGRDPRRLATAPFIVVFDLDDTLYDQYMEPAIAPSCHDIAWAEEPSSGAKGKQHFVKLTPGWADAIHRIHALGGAVVLFSANADDLCYANFTRWELDGVPITEHPAIAAVMTNSHLVLQPKHAGSPVVEPSKDLRIVDPELTRAIIVDDNPLRLFQFRNTRVFQKFKGGAYCTTKDPAAKRAYEQALKVVVDEIEGSLRYAKAHPGVSFVDAYLPYTTLGRIAVDWLVSGTGRTPAKAIAYLRQHPELASPKF